MAAAASAREMGPAGTGDVEALLRECERLRAAHGRAQVVRWILVLGVLGFVGASLWAFWGLAQRIRSESYMNALAAAAQARLEDRSEYYMGEAQALVRNVSPAVTEAFSAQLQRDLPRYVKALEAEYEPLKAELSRRIPERFNEHTSASLERFQAVMAEEVPALGDAATRQRVSRNLARALDELTRKYSVDLIEDRMRTLASRWEQFPPADPAGPGEARAEDRLTGELLDLLELRIVDRESASGR